MWGPMWYPLSMTRAELIARLLQSRSELETFGVAHLSLFGSFARDEADEESDVDVIVDRHDGEAFGFFKLFHIQEALSRATERNIDIFSRSGLSTAPRFLRRIQQDCVDVF